MTSGGIDWQREKWQSGLGSKFIHQGEKNAVKYADEVIVLSKGVQDYFKETYDRETHFIPNGVNRPQIREAKLITDHFGLEKDSYILFLGRLVPEKGIRYLVEAFKNVKTDKKLVIAGGSSDTDSFMEELKELAKGDDRILFTGFVQGAMLDELYSNAYIYTLPSDLEGMPLSLLEAMSYGNCCLVSDIPECAEVVEDKALIFKKSDVEDLREKLQDACDHPEMVMKMKNQAADFMNQHFSCGIEAARCYFGEKVVERNDYELIPNAIEVNRFVFDSTIRNRIRHDNHLENKHIVGHVGRFMSQKNHTFLLDVFAEVSKRDSLAHLVLLGDGELMDRQACFIQ